MLCPWALSKGTKRNSLLQSFVNDPVLQLIGTYIKEITREIDKKTLIDVCYLIAKFENNLHIKNGAYVTLGKSLYLCPVVCISNHPCPIY